MDKECERIDGDGHKNDPPVITNGKVKPDVDASCKAFCFINHICIFLERIVLALSLRLFSDMCYLCPVLTKQEKLLLANRERDKGNDAFRAKDYEEAVTYYSRSVNSL